MYVLKIYNDTAYYIYNDYIFCIHKMYLHVTEYMFNTLCI